MLAPYSPMDFLQAVAKERRKDPHILSTTRASVPTRNPLRRRLGRMAIRLGQRLEGNHEKAISETAMRVTGDTSNIVVHPDG